jgi:hypothetical protein
MDDVLGGDVVLWPSERAMLCTLVAVVIASLWVFLPQSEEPTSRPTTTRESEASWGIKAGRWITPQGKALYLEAVERAMEQQVLRTLFTRVYFCHDVTLISNISHHYNLGHVYTALPAYRGYPCRRRRADCAKHSWRVSL